jgi:hypothetical protein
MSYDEKSGDKPDEKAGRVTPRVTSVRAAGFVLPCIPTRAMKPPAGADWVHEIKHDGYRLQVRRDGDAVRLFTRRGCDWTTRYPAIAVTAAKLRAASFTIDGEAVVCGPDGVAVFDALHRHGAVSEANLRGMPRRPQEAPGEAPGAPARRHRHERTHGRRRRHHPPAGLPHRPQGHRVEV